MEKLDRPVASRWWLGGVLGGLAGIALINATPAAGSWVDHGTVTDVRPGHGADGGYVYFSVEGRQPPGDNGCHGTGLYAIEVRTAGGRARYAALLAAFLGGKRISALGDGSCQLPEAEEVVDLIVHS
jgi:hypothetical protein